MTDVDHRLVPEFPVLLGVEDIDRLGRRLHTVARLDRDDVAPLSTPARGDENHPVRTSRPVDGRRGRVLQNLDRLDVVGVDGHQWILRRVRRGRAFGERYAVDDVQRLAVGGEGVGAPYPHARPGAGEPRRREDLDACGPALQRIGHGRRRRRLNFQFVARDG